MIVTVTVTAAEEEETRVKEKFFLCYTSIVSSKNKFVTDCKDCVDVGNFYPSA